MNGQHAVFIGVQATPTGNPLTLVKGVRALMPEIQRNLPPSVKMQVAYDSTKFIQASIDEVESSLGLGRHHRCRRHFPVPRQPARGGDPDRDDPAVAGRRRYDHGGPGVQPESADLAGDGAGDRARRRRRDRRCRKRLSPYRAGTHPGAGGADRRSRDRQPGDLDDPDLGGGLCPDRLSRRRYRHAVSRIRLHPGRRGHHLRRRRGDLVADDVLAAVEPRDAARALCPGDRPRSFRGWPIGTAAGSSARSIIAR